MEELRASLPSIKSSSHDALVKWRGLDESEKYIEARNSTEQRCSRRASGYALRHQEDPVHKDNISELKIPFEGSVGSGPDPGTL